MEVRKLEDGSFKITGYVNIVEKPSRVMTNEKGIKFVERVEARCFTRALNRGNDVKLLLNHNNNIQLGTLDEGNVKLIEDNIGLKIEANVKHEEITKAYENGGFSGFSYGFTKIKDDYRIWDNGLQLRTLRDINLIEVSILDSKTIPAYHGSMVNIEKRSEENKILELRNFFNDKEEITDETRETTFDESCFFNVQNFIKTRR